MREAPTNATKPLSDFAAAVRYEELPPAVLRQARRFPKGDPGNPLSDEELHDKFRANTEGVVSPGETDELLGHIENLDDLQNLSRLTALLRRNAN